MVIYWQIKHPLGNGFTSYPTIYRKAKRIISDKWEVGERMEFEDNNAEEVKNLRAEWGDADGGGLGLGGENNEYWTTMNLHSAMDFYESRHGDIELPDESDAEEDDEIDDDDSPTYYTLRHTGSNGFAAGVGYTNMDEPPLKVEALYWFKRQSYWKVVETINIKDEDSDLAISLRKKYEDCDGGFCWFDDGQFITKGLHDAIEEWENQFGEIDTSHTDEDIARAKAELRESSDNEMDEDEDEDKADEDDNEADEGEDELDESDDESDGADDVSMHSGNSE